MLMDIASSSESVVGVGGIRRAMKTLQLAGSPSHLSALGRADSPSELPGYFRSKPDREQRGSARSDLRGNQPSGRRRDLHTSGQQSSGSPDGFHHQHPLNLGHSPLGSAQGAMLHRQMKKAMVRHD